MALEIKLNQKLSQTLVMTPQLQQAIKLLQLGRQEYLEVLERELLENPVLEDAREEDGENEYDESTNKSEAERSSEARAEIESDTQEFELRQNNSPDDLGQDLFGYNASKARNGEG